MWNSQRISPATSSYWKPWHCHQSSFSKPSSLFTTLFVRYLLLATAGRRNTLSNISFTVKLGCISRGTNWYFTRSKLKTWKKKKEKEYYFSIKCKKKLLHNYEKNKIILLNLLRHFPKHNFKFQINRMSCCSLTFAWHTIFLCWYSIFKMGSFIFQHNSSITCQMKLSET